MDYQLKNEYLQVSIQSKGAEITSVQSTEGLEYMWCGDEKYWGRHAPILFPIVGKIVGDTYKTDENESKEYALSQHGFARDSEFEVAFQDEKCILFVLNSSESTKERYPFDFSLRVRYELSDRTIKISYEVDNKDKDTMYFTIGGHPAFNCPLLEDETLEDYYIEFEVQEKAQKLLITPEVYLSGEVEEYEVQRINLSQDFFKDGVTILTGLESHLVTLKSKSNNHSITVDRKELPFLGLWSPEQGAPFICIEPWVGHTDYITNSKVLSEKTDFVELEEGKQFSCSYDITFK